MKIILVHQNFGNPRPGIVVGRHGKSIRSGAHHGQKIVGLHIGHHPFPGEKIAGFADGSHHVGNRLLPVRALHGLDEMKGIVEVFANDGFPRALMV